jgi:hypothetical protein
MDRAWEQQRQELAEKLRQTMERVRAEFDTDDPDWAPLEAALPIEECAGFIWMYRDQIEGAPIEVYRHGITRHWLQLGHDGTAYRWSEQDGYQPIPVDGAIEHVFEGLAELAATRETNGAEFLAERDARAAEAGWMVIS